MCDMPRQKQCAVTYNRVEGGVEFATHVGSRVFTIDELEAALRIAKTPMEKPIFIGYNDCNAPLKYQKRDGAVYFLAPTGNWCSTEYRQARYFTSSELEAIIKARNS